MTQDNQKAVQEKVMLYQILQNQLEEFLKQAEVLESRMMELEMTDAALQEMKSLDAGSGLLVPLGAGCYGYGTLKDRDSFMVEIGAGIVAKKSHADALAIVGDKKKEVENVGEKLKAEMEKLGAAMNHIGADIQKLSGAAQKKDDEDDDESDDSDDGVIVD
jgi:prefoldin alpha subunit